MKKALLYLCLAAGLMSCAKEIDTTPVQGESPAGVPMTFQVTVSDSPDTRAAKTAWAENDVIYVFFKGISGKYLKMTFDGSSWDIASEGGTLLDTDFSSLAPTAMTLTAVHHPAPVEVRNQSGTISFTKDGSPFLTYYLSDETRRYTVDGTTVTASLTLCKPEEVVLFHIPGIQDQVFDYHFTSSLVGSFGFSSVSSAGVISSYSGQGGARLRGFADADGAVFAGRLTQTGQADYTFTLTSSEKVYTLSRPARTLEAGKMYNFPALDSGAWTVADNLEEAYVDLGLPSGTLWAKTNLGARNPEDYGDYYAWGELAQKDAYTLQTYAFYDYDSHTFTKYTGSDYDNLLMEDDVAGCNLGGSWRYPTAEDWEELIDNCDITMTDSYEGTGVKGIILTSKTDGTKSIFLPANGMKQPNGNISAGSRGYYWSSTLYYEPSAAYSMNYQQGLYNVSPTSRYQGLGVRAVSGGIDPYLPEPQINNGYEYVDMGNGVMWATMNVGADKPEEYGDHFAWGATATHSSYDWANYPFMESGQSDWKYINKYTFADGQKEGIWYDGNTFVGDGMTSFADDNYIDDVARQNWGSTWRTPTDAEWAWLRKNCDWVWTVDYNETGKAGMVVMSKVTGFEGNSIFLPATGLCNGTSPGNVGSSGYYWSSTLSVGTSTCAYNVWFTSSNVGRSLYSRYYGHSVRPVFTP